MTRLLKQGLDRHDAIHAIGAIVAEHTFSLIRDESVDNPDQERFRGRLQKLTAKRWRSGHH